jgi:hypothetical protein
MCADLFELEWGDRHTTRYGRQGQRQHGVDIYGSPGEGLNAGVQCKGKRVWPPTDLTTNQVDEEVAKAKEFTPRLTEFTIVTTAPDDKNVQDHARAITERHKGEGLFSVHVMGWGEFLRGFTRYDALVRKHYPATFSLGPAERQKIDAIDSRTADIASQVALLVSERTPATAPPAAVVIAEQLYLTEASIAEALDRDLERRYRRAFQRMSFPEVAKSDEFAALAMDVLDGAARVASEPLRGRILLRAARAAALRGRLDEAIRYAGAAENMRGDDTSHSARARILVAQEKLDDALRLLRDEKDPEARGTMLSILWQGRNADAALRWLKEESLTAADLASGGVSVLACIHISKQDIAAALAALETAAEAVLSEQPYLLFLRGALRLASVFAKSEQGLVLHGYPVDVRSARPVLQADALAAALEAATKDLQSVLPRLIDLDLHEAQRIARALLTWCDLLHPHQKDAALARLRPLMDNPDTALTRLQFAFTFDPDFDPAPISRFLERRKELGGFTDGQLRAAFILRIHASDPRALADFLAEHRPHLEALFGKTAVVTFEVQALASAKDATSARIALDSGKDALGTELTTLLEACVATAEGADPVAEQKKAYELTKNVDALRLLVGELIRRNDHAALALYAQELYTLTQDPDDAVIAANALVRTGDDTNFLRFISEHPFVADRNPALFRHHAWKVLERGDLARAKAIADLLRTLDSGKHRDLQLEIILAIETGAWETLAVPLNDLLERASGQSGLTLIRAAHLAQASGQGPLGDLIHAAISRAPDDPQVLVGAYTIVLEEGLEDRRPQAREWFARAVDLSGDDGPIKRFEMKEVLAHHRHWNERASKVSEEVTKGAVPLIFAAEALHTSLVDLLLRNLVQSTSQADPRKRTALPLFSGRREPLPLGEVRRIAIDSSSLMTLAWLGLLPKVFETYPEIVLPASVLAEIFDGRARSQKLQKSLILRAKEIQAAIATRKIKVHDSPAATQDPLSREIGVEFVSLLRAAGSAGGLVVRPAPLYRMGSGMEQEADVSAFRDRLADLHSVLNVLVSEGLVDEATETTARHYLDIQDRGWQTAPTLQKDTPLFLDGLSLIYLHTVGLLDSVLDHFTDVSIDASTERNAQGFIEHESQTAEIIKVIDGLRDEVHKAWKAGKVTFGPRARLGDADDDEEEGGAHPSMINLLSNLMEAQVLVVDDRFLNKEPSATDNQGRRVHVATTLDLIEDLRSRNGITEEQQRAFRHRLRAAGAALVPVSPDEIAAAALRSKAKESAELRVIRQAIGLARITSLPRFPADVPWFAATSVAIHKAIVCVWAREPDHGRAAYLAGWLLDMALRPGEWEQLWEGQLPPGWSEAVQQTLTMHLAFPVELPDRATVDAYHAWLESQLLAPLRETRPDLYHGVVTRIRDLLLRLPFDENDDDEAG